MKLRTVVVALALTTNIIVVTVHKIDAADAQQACSPTEYEGDRVALVVGTDSYSDFHDEEIKTLINATHDATRLAAVLSNQGFKVRCVLDGNRAEVDREFSKLRTFLQTREQNPANTAKASQVLVYVAGHGYRDPYDRSDYLLLRPDPDADQIVDLSTLSGRIRQGRYSIQSLVDSFRSAPGHPVVFIFDACRAIIPIRRQNGTTTRGEATGGMTGEGLILNRVVAYSTAPGSTSVDSDPSLSATNGVYAEFLAQFIDQAGLTLSRIFNVTGFVVQAYRDDQRPEFVSKLGFILDKLWVQRQPSSDCERLNASIWNSIGSCAKPRTVGCVRQDICPAIAEFLQGGATGETRSCLQQHKQKWLKIDIPAVCTDGGNAVAQANVAPGYSVVNLEGAPPDSNRIAVAYLTGYAQAASIIGPAGKGPSPVDIRAGLDSNLSSIAGNAKERVVRKNRDALLSKNNNGTAPQTLPNPFDIAVPGAEINVRNLPSFNADAIDRFPANKDNVQIDCYTISCFDEWVGVRVQRQNSLYRGWVPIRELGMIATVGQGLGLQYDKDDISPNEETFVALRNSIGDDASKPDGFGRIQIVAYRIQANVTSALLANARLSFIKRSLIDLGLKSDDLIQTVVEVPMEIFPSVGAPVVINLGSATPRRQPAQRR
jgi:Caspase domain